MTSIRSWGAIVAAALAPAACSSAPPGPVTAPQPPASVVASAPPPATGPRLSGLVDVFTSAPPTRGGEGAFDVTGARFGRGLFFHQNYRVTGRRDAVCPFARAEGCGTFVLHIASEAPPTSEIWPPGGIDSPALALSHDRTAPSPFVAPHAWVAFAGGRDAVYALRKGGKHIDRIDEQGKVTPFVSDDAMKEWTEIWVIELHGRTFVAGMNGAWRLYVDTPEDSSSESWQLYEVLSGTSGQPRKLGPLTELPMRLMGPRSNAQGARYATRTGRMAAARLPQLLALPDEGDEKDRWAMVWLEIVPPDYSWPDGKPQKGVSRQPVMSPSNRPPKKRSRHDCGGPGSRSLHDVSVTKRAHITRFSGAKLLDDQVRWTGATTGRFSSYTFPTHLDDGFPIADLPREITFSTSSSGSPMWRDNGGSVEMPHDEELSDLAFDPGSREGVVVMSDHGRRFFRRFDASGKPLGEATEIDRKVPEFGAMFRVGDSWMVSTDEWRHLHNLSRQTGPFVHSFPDTVQSIQIVQGKGRSSLVYIDKDELFAVPLTPDGVASSPTKLAELPPKANPRRLLTFLMDGAEMAAIVVQDDTTSKLAWRPLTSDASWRFMALPAQLRSGDIPSFHDLGTDEVIGVSSEGQRAFVWLKSGKQATTPWVTEHGADHDEYWRLPLLGHGLRLPLAPGPVEQDDEIKGLGTTCPMARMTGLDMVVLACEHAPDEREPSRRVALRTLRLDR